MRRKQIARKSTGGRAPRKQLVVDERSSDYMDRATPGPDLTSDEEGGAGSRRDEGAIGTESSQGRTDLGTTSRVVEGDRDDQQMSIGGSSELNQGGAGHSGNANQPATIGDQVQSPEERIVELRRNIQELEKEVKELEERVVSKAEREEECSLGEFGLPYISKPIRSELNLLDSFTVDTRPLYSSL